MALGLYALGLHGLAYALGTLPYWLPPLALAAGVWLGGRLF